MLMMLAAPLAVLAAVALPAPLSRFVGIAILAAIAGLTWRAAMVIGVDLILVLGGAALVRRSVLVKLVADFCAKRLAAAFMAFLAAEFGVFALLIANMTGDAMYPLPFDLGFLLSSVSFVVLMARGREQGFMRKFAGSFVPASQYLRQRHAIRAMKIAAFDAAEGEPCVD